MVGIYFEENDKNRYKFFIASILSDAGVDPRDIVRQVGNYGYVYINNNDLTSQDKKHYKVLQVIWLMLLILI